MHKLTGEGVLGAYGDTKSGVRCSKPQLAMVTATTMLWVATKQHEAKGYQDVLAGARIHYSRHEERQHAVEWRTVVVKARLVQCQDDWPLVHRVPTRRFSTSLCRKTGVLTAHKLTIIHEYPMIVVVVVGPTWHGRSSGRLACAHLVCLLVTAVQHNGLPLASSQSVPLPTSIPAKCCFVQEKVNNKANVNDKGRNEQKPNWLGRHHCHGRVDVRRTHRASRRPPLRCVHN
mmetsp:Transcript_5351/g.17249  ORF Transcript_5351/g.17249 Transcript_5351/m.17249 type:complete len:231 (-) Transcript_5351:85-777(-)